MQPVHLLFFFATGFIPSLGQTLVATHLTARLPSSSYSMASYYDGDDSIYLFGGRDEDIEFSRVSKFSISNGTLTSAGQLPNRGQTRSGAHLPTNGDQVFYFGSVDRAVHTYDPENQNSSTVGSTSPVSLYDASIVRYAEDSNLAYILSGKSVATFDMGNHAWNQMPDITLNITRKSVLVFGNMAYIFGIISVGENQRYPIYTLNLDTFEVITTDHYFPGMLGDSAAVKVGEEAYILGGYWRTVLPTNGIIKFNSATQRQCYNRARFQKSLGHKALK